MLAVLGRTLVACSLALAASFMPAGGTTLAARTDARAPAPPTLSDVLGTWAGSLTHEGETQEVALGIAAGKEGRAAVTFHLPVAHLDGVPFGEMPFAARGDSIRLGPFAFAYDARAGTLSGVMPSGLVPVYAIPIRLHRVERFTSPPRPALTVPSPKPLWTFSAGSPLWAGPVYAGGRIYAGAQDGWLHALDAATGERVWAYRTGGPIRTRPTAAGGSVYLPSDDGHLHRVAASDGRLLWRVKIVDGPIERLPFDHPKSRFDRFGSDVTVTERALYVGTHDGKVLALDPADGRRLWSFAAGDAVLAAPAVAAGRVVFGSFDRHVYALDAATGALLWKRDTRGAVVSTPALLGNRVVVGNRAYDLLGLDARTGEVAWKRYIWSSWVESSATIRDGVAYVGSSDAAAVYAFDAAGGRRVWATDVYGWAWGQPAVSRDRVYTGTASQAGYLAQHAGGLLALDRKTGAVVWRFTSPPSDSGAYGFPGSTALGMGRVYATGLDGRVYAFEP